MTTPAWLKRLQNRWQLPSIRQTLLALLVFALTGTSVALLKRPLFWLLGFNAQSWGWLGTVIYLLLVLPLYNVLLLMFGAMFGMFDFFWAFERKMWHRLTQPKHTTTK